MNDDFRYWEKRLKDGVLQEQNLPKRAKEKKQMEGAKSRKHDQDEEEQEW
jgi:hypothetical protein